MQLTRNIFKYLENFSIDYFKLNNFKKDTVNNFINYTPIIDFDVKSDNDFSFKFTNVDVNLPLIFNLDYSANLSDRKTIEIDILSETSIDENAITLNICSGVNGNAIRGTFKNVNRVEPNVLTTVIFDLGNINNSRLRQYSSIKSLSLNIGSNSFFICNIGAYNGEYILTYNDMISLVNSSKNYVLNRINSKVMPYDAGLYEAIYKLTAYYIWQRETTTPRNTKKGYEYLKNEANEFIKYYLNGGYHPNLQPFTDTVKKRGSNVVINEDSIDDLMKNHSELIKILYGDNNGE